MTDNQETAKQIDPLQEQPPGPPGAFTDSPQTEQETDIPLNPTESTTMEVHHPPHIHHKKKWKDYLFEFFMLFLAVSAGFFVENLREHYVEHQRAKEYAAMLRKDLAADTTIMNIIAGYRNEQAKKYEAMKNIMDSVPFDKINQQQFVTLAEPAGRYLHLIPNNGTLQQLKSSGSLRYFTDTSLVYTLTSYEEDLKHGEYVQAEEKEYFITRMSPFKLQHFNFRLLKAGATATGMNFPETMLVDFDKKTMMTFYNLLQESQRINEVLGEQSFIRHKKKAAEIIKILNKEYRLE